MNNARGTYNGCGASNTAAMAVAGLPTPSSGNKTEFGTEPIGLK